MPMAAIGDSQMSHRACLLTPKAPIPSTTFKVAQIGGIKQQDVRSIPRQRNLNDFASGHMSKVIVLELHEVTRLTVGCQV